MPQTPNNPGDLGEGIDVAVIGAGLAGLSAAERLRSAGREVVLLEASDGVGGRVRTDRLEDEHGAFLIDRGLQVYLTAYPEGRRVLRPRGLGLRAFAPGAMVRCEGRFWPAADPLHSASSVDICDLRSETRMVLTASCSFKV